MFVTTQLNVLTQVLCEHGCSENVIEQLNQRFVNLEATLLRAKVLREFSKKKSTAIIQSAITSNHLSLAYLFSPFILANLNQTVLYSTVLTAQVQDILKPYYQVEKTMNLTKDDVVLESLNLFLDLQDQTWDAQEFVYFQLFKALTQAEVDRIFLITDQPINPDYLFEIECFFKVRIFLVNPENDQDGLNLQLDHHDHKLNMQKLLFKYKDDFYVALCRKFSEMNAKILNLSGLYDLAQ
ncbi:MAG: hypothetical protein ACTIMQ_12180, partial [Acinetobacter guillouiae]